ncbi:Type I phosphodiesterase/nucleotide pyrophosphatase [Ceratobasidium theobromae]|uniref:Type I phosphodiesterase/nucleotide pyrophosphatase n=1 Tax=Ceratobasidium theobromae TaxID=1582974 RepID=A0A5N5QIG9_9AGAM|nr:Type I phosphodiesterase/nucleotide pyrophosphatase [Ceratobasidium theobromae]
MSTATLDCDFSASTNLITTKTMSNTDKEIGLLQDEIKRLGEKPASGPGIAVVKFGKLVKDEKCSNLFEALNNVLRSAKKKGIVAFDGEILLQGAHDNVDVVRPLQSLDNLGAKHGVPPTLIRTTTTLELGMSTSSLRPNLPQTLPIEEASGSSTNEQTPLLSSHQTQSDHRLLGLFIPPWLPRRYIVVLVGFISMMMVVLVSVLFLDPIWRREQLVFMNNGTHDFRKTVIVISFDGFRADYLERGLTPHLVATGDSGLRARWMQPSYPALTFPNHWSIMTGLYPESHGIIANEFIEPETGAHFFYQHPDESWDAAWWGGEPMWETAVKAGMKTANLMWPGPPVTRNGIKPTYFTPFRVNMTLFAKADQVLEWIDMRFEDRPQLVTMYEPLIDDVGHRFGPDSPEMTRNLTSIVDVIFVSDHGMAPTHDRKWIYLDDILGEEGANEIDWKLGQPSAGLWFHPGTNVTGHLEKLYSAAARPPHNLRVYTATNAWPNGVEVPPGLQNPFPARKHFSPDHNSRIPPVYVVPEMGWSVTWHREQDPWYARGDHGYDNEHELMRAVFIASGPFTDRVRAQVSSRPSRFSRVKTMAARPPIYVPPRGGDPVLIEQFENVEVYGLVMRLLGISQVAHTNGTAGFWDTWFTN